MTEGRIIQPSNADTFSTSEDTTLDLLKINHFRGVDWEEAKKMKASLHGHFYTDTAHKMPYLLYPKADKVRIY